MLRPAKLRGVHDLEGGAGNGLELRFEDPVLHGSQIGEARNIIGEALTFDLELVEIV